MKKIHIIKIQSGILLAGLINTFTFVLAFSQPLPEMYKTGLPFNMPDVQLPTFPDRIVNIVDYGAVKDGQTLNTKSFAEAIEACAKAGGGKVVVPAGVWLTGPIKMESNINLYLEHGALIIFSKNIKDYPIVLRPTPLSKNFGYLPLISGYNLENIAITGFGIIDGSGEKWRPMKKEKYTEEEWQDVITSGGFVNTHESIWWPSKEAMNATQYIDGLNKDNKHISEKDVANTREYLRPNMIEFYGCKNILLDGPTFQSSPKFVLYPTQCKDVVIRNISVRNPWNAQNGDGIDINSCHNVVVYNCVVDVGDDGICLKLGKVEKSRGWDAACENIVIADCNVYHAHGGFVIGSNTEGGARNISVRNCIFSGTDIGLRFKSGQGRGGLIENVYINGIVMNNIVKDAILFDLFYINIGVGTDPGIILKKHENISNDEFPARFQKFYIDNITCQGARRAVYINSQSDKCIREINFNNITISAKEGVTCSNAEGLKFVNMNIFINRGSIYNFNESRNIIIDHSTYSESAELFLKVSGSKSDNIELISTDLSKAKKGIVLENDVRPNAVIQK